MNHTFITWISDLIGTFRGISDLIGTFRVISDLIGTFRVISDLIGSASKSVEIFWAEIYWGRPFLRAESSLIQSSCRSFIRVIVPYEISKVNFRVETKIIVSV
jgi:hypothetical protein